jgi:hypothetical protein
MMNGVLTPCSAAEFEQWLTEAARAMMHHSDSKASIIGLAAHAFSSLRLAAEQRAEEITRCKADRAALEELYAVTLGECPSNLEDFDPLTELLSKVDPPLPKALEHRGRAERLRDKLHQAEAELSSLKTEHDRLQRLVRDGVPCDGSTAIAPASTDRGDSLAALIEAHIVERVRAGKQPSKHEIESMRSWSGRLADGEPHPWYGPCDGLGNHNGCSECQRLNGEAMAVSNS